MNYETLFSENLSRFNFTGTGAKKTATTNDDLLIIPDVLHEADKYIIKVNDNEYVCNMVESGTNWWSFKYRIDNMDVISIRKNKNDGTIEISLRPEMVTPNIDINTDTLSLLEIMITPVESGEKTAIVRFTRDKAVKVIYDVANDEITAEEV